MEGIEDLSQYTAEALKHMDRFNPTVDKFPIWLNKFETGVFLLGVKDEEKVPFLIDIIQIIPYKILKIRCGSDNPLDFPYSVLTYKLTEDYSGRESCSLAMYRFFNRDQMPEETVSQYVLALKILVITCCFHNQEKAQMFKKFSTGLKSQKARNTIKKLQIDETSEKVYEELFECALAIALECERIETQQWIYN
ncbi:PREDICTED: uncharacterized protein LOC106792451 [Polistes canadensis]|uniref:uncharacterized protein LOC106792451 n=1 Tax=Polistes canadensis TaxID=91411 RepID=UPI000718B49C|nr:PREDICTED: uncharacterized protein LOC106792451 [Polistes canadensis]